MTPRKLGSTGLMIGPLGLGSVNFSWLTDEPHSFAILDAAFERGINLLDTSDSYNAGQTEALIGQYGCARVLDARRPKFGQDLQPVTTSQIQTSHTALGYATALLGAGVLVATD